MEENKEKDTTGVSEMIYFCFNENNFTSSQALPSKKAPKMFIMTSIQKAGYWKNHRRS